MQAYGRRLCNRLVLVWLLCVPGWALAAPQLVEQVNAEQLAFVLRALGYERSRIDGDGDLLVALDTVDMLAMVGSYGGRYVSLQAPLVGADVSLQAANEWNRVEPYARVYINESGYAVLGAELDLTGGVTVAHIEHFVRTFVHTSVPKFVERMR